MLGGKLCRVFPDYESDPSPSPSAYVKFFPLTTDVAPLTLFMKHENTSCMNRLTIRTVRELVDAFGGTGKLAAFLEIVPSAVSNMLADDSIPRGYHLEIYLEAGRRGWEIDKARLFGILEPTVKRQAARVA